MVAAHKTQKSSLTAHGTDSRHRQQTQTMMEQEIVKAMEQKRVERFLNAIGNDITPIHKAFLLLSPDAYTIMQVTQSLPIDIYFMIVEELYLKEAYNTREIWSTIIEIAILLFIKDNQSDFKICNFPQLGNEEQVVYNQEGSSLRHTEMCKHFVSGIPENWLEETATELFNGPMHERICHFLKKMAGLYDVNFLEIIFGSRVMWFLDTRDLVLILEKIAPLSLMHILSNKIANPTDGISEDDSLKDPKCLHFIIGNFMHKHKLGYSIIHDPNFAILNRALR